MDTKKYMKKKKLSSKESSVHFDDKTRFNKAEEQADMPSVSVEKIISLTNNFLKEVGIPVIENPIVDNDFINKLTGESFTLEEIESHNEFYKKLKDKFNLNDSRDIVWMKFSREENDQNKIGVVATSNDINFDLPMSKSEYNDKTRSRSWKYTTSGILLNYIKKEWDKSFVLVFPLAEIPSDLTRHDIETGIGNYLIANNVPIIDFYSHNF